MTDKPPSKSTPRIATSPQPLLFILYNEPSSSSNKSTISHARRWQSDKKSRDRKISAQQGATYARSLVGWQSSSLVKALPNSTTSNIADGQQDYCWQKEYGALSQKVAGELKAARANLPAWEEEPHQRDIPPSTILNRGHSDPFNALAVEVTPEVNAIISFFREHMIPAFYDVKWKASRATIIESHWQSIVNSLQDRGTALGFLGRNGQFLAIVSQNRRIRYAALKYTSESTVFLRTRLGKVIDLSSTDQWHISMLWGTEILFRNLKAALLHGQMLRRMAEDQAAKGTLDLLAFRYILFYDIHLCTMLMVQSVFDYFNWVPEQYQKLQALATSFMRLPVEGEDDAANGLDQCIGEEVLLPIFRERRRHMAENAWWLQGSYGDINPLLYAWLSVRHHICHGQLITYALNCMDEAANSPTGGVCWLLTQAAISLAALYVTRAGAGGQLILCGVDIFEGRRSILSKLYMAMKWLGNSYNNDDQMRYENGKLWALYVGSRGARTLKTKETDDYAWFTREFNKLREQMGLSSWAQTREILKGFLHHENIDPTDDEKQVELVE